MAGREVRIMAEGAMRWVVASGTGQTWGTASAPVTGLIGFVQAGGTFTQTRNVLTVKERGVPHHHKVLGREPIEFNMTFMQAVTANYPPTASTSQGASVPQVNFELMHTVSELGGPTAQYHQFVNATFVSQQFTEPEDGNRYQQTWRAINYVGPTASGYLATGGQ